MKKMFQRRLWVKVLAVLLAFSLNLGALDGLVRLTMQELALGTFDGFLTSAIANDLEADQNQNTLPPTAGKKKPKNPKAEEAKDNKEIKSKRTAKSKTFKIGENKYKKEVFLEPVHYVNSKNELVEIDNNLIETKEKGFDFQNRANNFKVRFVDQTDEKKLGQIQQKLFSIEWALLNGEDVTGDASRNTITYSDIIDKVDLKYTVDGSTLKEDIILTSPGVPTEFKFKLDLRHLDYEMQEDGSIEVKFFLSL